MKSSRLLFCCVAVGLALPACVGPETAVGPAQKASNGMTYTHENMGNGRHMLTVKDTRFGISTMANIDQSITVFAHRWSAQRFPKGYELHSVDGYTRMSSYQPSRSFIITETR
jgi:hypothetical protein